MVKAKLRCLKGDQVEVTFEGEARIGRSGRNQLVIPAPVVSAEHARVWYDGDADAFFIEDLGSTNGTEVANRKVTGPELLLPLDVIVLGGEIEVLFHRVGMPATRAPAAHTPTPEDAPALGGTPPPAPPGTRVLSPGEEPRDDAGGTLAAPAGGPGRGAASGHDRGKAAGAAPVARTRHREERKLTGRGRAGNSFRGRGTFNPRGSDRCRTRPPFSPTAPWC
jgi:hypothetical protein